MSPKRNDNEPAGRRMIFLERCQQVVVQGITVSNSPSWNIHPYFSDHLKFLDLKVSESQGFA